MRYGSVCSGMEAATLAWKPLGWECAFVSEIEKAPSALLARRYPDVPNLGDMTKFAEWPDFAIDLLVGGTPCQSFSVAGLRKGLADPRGDLMLTYGAIAQRYRPAWLLWENVPGVLSSDGGRDFGSFLGMLAELGYGFAYRILDAQYFNLAQRRARVFVVGYLGDWRPPAAVLFERESLRGDSPPRREARERAAGTIAGGARRSGGYSHDDTPLVEAFGGNNTSGSIDVATAVNAHGGPTGRLDFESETFIAHALRADGFDASEDGTGRGTPLVPVMSFDSKDMTLGTEHVTSTMTTNGNENHAGGRLAIAFSSKDHGADASDDLAPTLRAMGHADGHANADKAGALPSNSNKDYNAREVDRAQAVTAQGGAPSARGGDVVVEQWAVRRLTPRECERLQGAPDDHTLVTYRGKPMADGPRYKMIGNSFAVPVVRWIGERIELVQTTLEPRP